MSILKSLLRFIDPVEHRQQQAEEQRKREVIPPETDPKAVEIVVPPRAAKPRPRLTCRVCGHAGTDRYCPFCRAETMEPSHD